jgi:ribosomal protein S6
MPCYQLLLLARPDITPEKLSELFRLVARVVYREHGQFRTIENFGVRPLAFPIRKSGQKFEEVRWIHAFFDVAPSALGNVNAAISSEKGVLQAKVLRSNDALSKFSPATRREKLAKFSTAMKYNATMFDPETLETHVASPSSVELR